MQLHEQKTDQWRYAKISKGLPYRQYPQHWQTNTYIPTQQSPRAQLPIKPTIKQNLQSVHTTNKLYVSNNFRKSCATTSSTTGSHSGTMNVTCRNASAILGRWRRARLISCAGLCRHRSGLGLAGRRFICRIRSITLAPFLKSQACWAFKRLRGTRLALSLGTYCLEMSEERLCLFAQVLSYL
jgi:hypothetical protein